MGVTFRWELRFKFKFSVIGFRLSRILQLNIIEHDRTWLVIPFRLRCGQIVRTWWATPLTVVG